MSFPVTTADTADAFVEAVLAQMAQARDAVWVWDVASDQQAYQITGYVRNEPVCQVRLHLESYKNDTVSNPEYVGLLRTNAGRRRLLNEVLPKLVPDKPPEPVVARVGKRGTNRLQARVGVKK